MEEEKKKKKYYIVERERALPYTPPQGKRGETPLSHCTHSSRALPKQPKLLVYTTTIQVVTNCTRTTRTDGRTVLGAAAQCALVFSSART